MGALLSKFTVPHFFELSIYSLKPIWTRLPNFCPIHIMQDEDRPAASAAVVAAVAAVAIWGRTQFCNSRRLHLSCWQMIMPDVAHVTCRMGNFAKLCPLHYSATYARGNIPLCPSKSLKSWKNHNRITDNLLHIYIETEMHSKNLRELFEWKSEIICKTGTLIVVGYGLDMCCGRSEIGTNGWRAFRVGIGRNRKWSTELSERLHCIGLYRFHH